MKTEKWINGLIAALLAFCISLGGVACIVTGFSLPGVDMAELTVFCLIFPVICSVCFTLRKGPAVLVCALALTLGYLLREGQLLLSLESLIYRISEYYDSGYHWGVLYWSDVPPLTLPAQPKMPIPLVPALQLVGAIPGFLISYAVCRQKNTLLAIPVSLLPLLSCMVLTDTVPGVWCIFLLTVPLLLLALTQTLRRRSIPQGNRLTALLLLPVLLLSSLFFRAMPQTGYEQQVQQLQQLLSQWFPELPFVESDGTLTVSPQPIRQNQVSLTTVGPKINLYFSVMNITSELGGLVYLRGQSYNHYDGKSWTSSDVDESLLWPSDSRLIPAGSLTVSTRLPSAIRYAPYYLSNSEYLQLQQGALSSDADELLYAYPQYVENLSAILPRPSGIDDSFQISGSADVFLELPHATREAAVKYLAEHLGTVSMLEVQQIVDLVQDSALYDLNTPRMPDSEPDFALWFLRESDTGYCVHFATAATVLLRAAGFPARYVTGYTVSAEPGVETRVTMDRAHAWVEYLDPGFGWRVLDPTPPDLTQNSGETTAPTDESTDPSEETTLPTDPQESTLPSQTRPEDDTPNEPSVTVWDLSWLFTLLRILAAATGVVLLVLGQYTLRCRRKHKKLHSGTANERALRRWQEVLRLSRLLGTEPPEELESLAEKAKFSQHTLDAGELLTFRQYLDQCHGAVNAMPVLKKWVYKLIFAIA